VDCTLDCAEEVEHVEGTFDFVEDGELDEGTFDFDLDTLGFVEDKHGRIDTAADSAGVEGLQKVVLENNLVVGMVLEASEIVQAGVVECLMMEVGWVLIGKKYDGRSMVFGCVSRVPQVRSSGSG